MEGNAQGLSNRRLIRLQLKHLFQVRFQRRELLVSMPEPPRAQKGHSVNAHLLRSVGESGPPRKETPLHIKGEEQPQLPCLFGLCFLQAHQSLAPFSSKPPSSDCCLYITLLPHQAQPPTLRHPLGPNHLFLLTS